MSAQSILKADEIARLLELYGINPCCDFKLLSGGSENTNYHVRAAGSDYVLTISEQKSLEKNQRLANLLDYLAKHNFRSSVVLRSLNGQAVNQWRDKAVILKSYIRGGVVVDLPHNTLIDLGSQLASLHMLAAPEYLPTQVSFGRQAFARVAIYAAHSDFHDWLNNIDSYLQDYLSPTLPKSLIHSDIFYNNIIVDAGNNCATIMDFEEASYYYRIFDIGMMIVGSCCPNYQFDQTKLNSLLVGYQRKVTLTQEEIKSLQAFCVYAGAATVYWRHQNYHYVNKNEDMFDHHIPLQNLVNEIQRLPASVFTEAILETSCII